MVINEPWRKLCGCLALMLGALSELGCTYRPLHNDYVDPLGDIQVAGFAAGPGATVLVEAYNHYSKHWDVLASATSATEPFTFAQNSAYGWTATINFKKIPFRWQDMPDWHCYWTSTCTLWRGNQAFDTIGRLRAREIGNSMRALYSFDQAGMDCIGQRVGDGDSWFAAGLACRFTDYRSSFPEDTEGVIHMKWRVPANYSQRDNATPVP